MEAYQQDLYKIVTPIPKNVLKKKNRYKKWEYGYNKEHDLIIISKDGTIGEIYDIQGLVVALPRAPKEISGQELAKEDQRWTYQDEPKELSKIRSILERENKTQSFKDK